MQEAVYTLEEVGRYLKVPVEAIRKEIAAGRLRAMNVGGFIRIGEFALSAYKNLVSEGVTLEGLSSVDQHTWLQLQSASDFEHTWPDGKIEQFREAQEGTASYAGRIYRIKLGFTIRESAGRRRMRCLVIVDRYPTVEFVKENDHNEVALIASIIKDRANKQIPSNAEPPREYEGMPVRGYRAVVDGPGAPNGLAVVCNSDNFETMVKHAVIRYRYREERSQKAGS